jgi:predicted acylesterase/phospholipase RssA
MATEPWTPTGLSLSSGGAASGVQFGALARLLETGTLHQTRNWYGCSAGTLLAFMGCLGVSSAWLRDCIYHFEAVIISRIEEEALDDFLNGWGMNSGQKVIDFFSRLVETWETGCSSWTFADMARERPGTTLTIIATNVSQGCQAIFDVTRTPTMKIMDAVRASTAIPLFYQPWVDASGNFYSDGAIIEYYPWACVADKDNTLVVTCSDTGITGRALGFKKITSITDYVGRVGDLLQHRNTDITPKNWIAVNNMEYGVFDFDMSREERLALFDEGAAAVDRWISFQAKVTKDRASSEQTPKSPPACVRSNHTYHALPRDPDKTLGSPPPYSPPPPLAPSRDLHSGGARPARRWSL